MLQTFFGEETTMSHALDLPSPSGTVVPDFGIEHQAGRRRPPKTPVAGWPWIAGHLPHLAPRRGAVRGLTPAGVLRRYLQGIRPFGQ